MSRAMTFSRSSAAEQSEQGARASGLRKQSNDDRTSEQSDDSTDAKKRRKKCLIYPDNQPKRVWDASLGILLIVMCLTIPFHLALYFHEPDSTEMIVFNRALDLVFGIDILLTFNTAM